MKDYRIPILIMNFNLKMFTTVKCEAITSQKALKMMMNWFCGFWWIVFFWIILYSCAITF